MQIIRELLLNGGIIRGLGDFMTTEEAAMITVDGTYRLVGDSLYIEEQRYRRNHRRNKGAVKRHPAQRF